MTELSGSSFVKICGVTTMDDAVLVRDAGADAFGLIVAPSRRRVSTGQARSIMASLRGSILGVMVTRALSDLDVLAAVDEVEPDGVQLHDPAPATLLDELRHRGCFVIRALSADAPDYRLFDDRLVDAVLVDGPEPGRGVAHAWDHVAERPWTRSLIAAGGLTSLNVSDAIHQPWVWGVDVATGVERRPGVKDPQAVKSFVAAARRAFRERS